MSKKTMGIFFMRVIWPFCQSLPPGKKSGYKPKKQFINNKKESKMHAFEKWHCCNPEEESSLYEYMSTKIFVA